MVFLSGADVGLGDSQLETLHTNTQYLLGEFGRLGCLVQDSKMQGYLFTYTKGSKGNTGTKLNHLCTSATPITPMYRFTSVPACCFSTNNVTDHEQDW